MRPLDRDLLPPRVLWAIVTVVACTAIVIGALRVRADGGGTSDFDDFWRTARFDLIQRGTMSERWGVHNYLPFFVLMLAPLGMLPLKAASVVWGVVSVGSLALTVVLVERFVLASGRRWSSRGAWIPIGLTLAYAWDCVVLGQTALIVGALIVLTWVLVEQRREWSAGVVLALAVAIKLFPIVLALFFLLKRRWRVLGGLALGLGFFVGALPAAAFGRQRSAALHREFLSRSVAGQSILALAGSDSNKMHYANQSLPLVIRRLTTPTYTGIRRGDVGRTINVVTLPDAPLRIAGVSLLPVQWVVAGIAVLLVSASIVVLRHPARVLAPAREQLEFGACVLLSMLLSPILWTFYFALCYLPLALLADEAAGQPSARGARVDRIVLWMWAAATPLLALPLARAAGVHWWLTLLLMVQLWRAAARYRIVRAAAA